MEKKTKKVTKKQEKNEKIIYAIVISFALILSLVVIIINLTKLKTKKRERIDDINDEVERLSSKKSGQIQTVDNVKIHNIEIIRNVEETEVFSTIQNETQDVLGDFEVTIKLKDENENIIYAYGYIPEIQPGSTMQTSSVINKTIGNIKEIQYYKK